MIVYTITGTPVSIVKNSHMGRRVFDEFNLNRFNHQRQLREQHADKDLLNSIHALEVEFYFDETFGKTKGYSPHRPALSSLLKYLDDILHGVVYENEFVVTHVIASKHYNAPESKTILTFTPLKEKNGKKNT